MLNIVAFFSLAAALGTFVVVLYSKKIHSARDEYINTKHLIDDIIFSLNKQFQNQSKQLESLTKKIDSNTLPDNLIERLEQQVKEIAILMERTMSPSTFQQESQRIDKLEDILSEALTMNEAHLEKIEDLRKQRSQKRSSNTSIRSAIPIKREKALAPLNETELAVLELLSTRGKGSTPEIKENIGLSREHTARLLKKLYEEGYLERSSGKVPFTYQLKDEMRKILKKT